ncbi:MAG: endolytic transglycosylase MltG [Candidatus Velamenicoccus archaeovorus]
MVETPTAHVEQPGPRRHGPPPHRGLRLGLAFLVLAGLVVAAGVRYYAWCGDASGPQRPVTFTVAEGASGDEIVDALHERGVLRCGRVSTWLLRRSGKADRIRAGTYRLTTNMTPAAAFDALSQAPPPAPTVDLTIPEGFRLSQIAARVQQVLQVPAGRFLHVAETGAWSLPPYLPAGKPLEGFLFPNTYEFLEQGTTAQDVIGKLLDEFGTEAAALPWDRAEDLGVTPYQVVTIASMIEEEARIERDRPLISAVIYNRLAGGMPLGIDATVAYVDPDPSNGLTASDFEIRSPYNTRLHAGLPPTPIASPGLAALRAALEPADVPYLYYVLCGADGHHAFSVSYARFLQDKARCLG